MKISKAIILAVMFVLVICSVSEAAGPGTQYRRLLNKVFASKGEDVPVIKKPSIAPQLGVPDPVTMKYTRFDPENIKKQNKNVRAIFAIPPELAVEVDFWTQVYTKYDKTKVVFHDKEDLSNIYAVMDISDIVNNKHLTDEQKKRMKSDRVEGEFDRLAKTLSQVKKDQLRSQTGISEKFLEGMISSGKYLGEMEKIFAQDGIPLEVTRLPFVESMFNLKARSKVGASGIWQFMPSSGRLYMTVNKIVDERNDPILATHGASRHLITDYKEVGTWPLAVNSYNSGRGRLISASNRLGTKNLATIIKNYDGPGYGFASRNFYPAFLAALNAFENREKYFGKVVMDGPLSFDLIQTPYPIILPDVVGKAGVPMDEMIYLNFHLQDNVVDGRLPLPKGFELKAPHGKGEDLLVAIRDIGDHIVPVKAVKPRKAHKTGRKKILH